MRRVIPLCIVLALAGCGEDAATRTETTAAPPKTVTVQAPTTPKPKPKPVAARVAAFMPCDAEDYSKTLLKVRPKVCSVLTGSNGVGAGSIAEGVRLESIVWSSWGGATAKGRARIPGQKTGDPGSDATFTLESERCEDLRVYTTLEATNSYGTFTVRLDADCQHLAAVPASEAATPEPEQNNTEDLERRLDEQQKAIDAAKDRECAALYDRWQRGRSASGGSDEEGQAAIQEYGRLLCSQR